MYLNKTGKYSTVILFLLLGAASIGLTYMIAMKGIAIAPLSIIVVGSVFLLAMIIRDYAVGLYALFFLGGFLFEAARMISIPIPLGVVYDVLAALIFVALFVNNKKKLDWTYFKNPITIMFVIITIYQLLQFFNPNAVSTVGWFVAARNNTSLLLYVVCFQLFASMRSTLTFTKVWLAFGVFVALYGIKQEFLGLTDFEHDWLYSSPERVGLYQIWGRLRKFSILSDPSSFGLFTAYTGLAFVALAMGPFKPSHRISYAFLAMISFVSMSYSGTRTAMAMVAVGIAFFIVMTMQDKKTILAASGLVFVGIIVLVGPFYGGTVNRIRSTFNPSEDPSMAVRDVKRVRLQEYVLSHPIGGGLNTTGRNGKSYSPGHELAGGWDPDSGYLLTALEMGWIGLIIFQVFFFIVMLRGIQNYFAINDPLLRTLNLTYLVPFLALSVAHFTQDAMFQKPVNLIVIATYAVIVRIPTYQKKLFSVDLV